MKRALLPVMLLLAGCGVQPTVAIGGSRATGSVIYLVRNGTVEPVLRPSRHEASELGSLMLLTVGVQPHEQALGYTSEVPRDLGPTSADGPAVTVQLDVTTLSTVAVAQIACTASPSRPVTLRGGGQTRGPVSCPA